MIVKVKFLPPLSRMVGRAEMDIELIDGSMKELFDRLTAKEPRLKTTLFEEDGSLSLEYSCLLNQGPVPREGLINTILKDGDQLTFLMPIAGG